MSVNLPKSEFGQLTIPYLSHAITAESIRAMPKTVKSVQELPLNYYHKLIEDFSVMAAALHELTDEKVKAGNDLSRTRESFAILKRKIVSTPLLRHHDQNKPFMINPHANRWVACVVLEQEYDGKILPMWFLGRYWTYSGISFGDVQYSALSWLLKAKSANGRCVRWGVILPHWHLEVNIIQSDEDGLAAIMGAGITPREHLD
ncbi:reverse transcriptase [Phytophthora megakarya]|uniref:Reverse transcriptase n=1 Tax=Phytophthora megakarya TaxID=4795 RepID=A0A225WR09_9STRA|nr:reverse transcriptase [Phytophthora megakarya]